MRSDRIHFACDDAQMFFRCGSPTAAFHGVIKLLRTKHVQKSSLLSIVGGQINAAFRSVSSHDSEGHSVHPSVLYVQGRFILSRVSKKPTANGGVVNDGL